MRKVKTRKSIRKEDIEDLIYYKLKNDRFKQQRLPAWRPVPTLLSIIIFYVLFALVFIALGIVILVYSSKIVTVEIPYSSVCKGKDDCFIEATITQDMKPPIMVYYKLDGFFQNHRRYVKSKSLEQLLGNSWSDKGDCTPVITNEDMGVEKSIDDDDQGLNPKEVACPCGLLAKTYFNDTYTQFMLGNENITQFVNEKNIAFSKDKALYHNVKDKKGKQWIDIEDEHFIVWMRPAGLPNFRKLWARIENKELKKGDKISITVENNYDKNNEIFDKSIILSTTNELGGKNTFLGVSFIVVGIISLLLGIAFPLLIYQRNKNESMRKNY